jgi:hypothetical protein
MSEVSQNQKAPKKAPRNNLRPPWKLGESGNPKGRMKGKRNFATIFKIATEEVAEALQLEKKPDAVQIELVKRGIKEGLKGSYSFYKDIMDRLYGQVKQPIEHEFDDKIDSIEIKIKKN